MRSSDFGRQNCVQECMQHCFSGVLPSLFLIKIIPGDSQCI